MFLGNNNNNYLDTLKLELRVYSYNEGPDQSMHPHSFVRAFLIRNFPSTDISTVLNDPLTFTTLWANSADDKLIFFSRKQVLTFHAHCLHSADNKLMFFFLFFLENRTCHFMQIVSIGDSLHEMSKPVFWGKYHQFVIC